MGRRHLILTMCAALVLGVGAGCGPEQGDPSADPAPSASESPAASVSPAASPSGGNGTKPSASPRTSPSVQPPAPPRTGAKKGVSAWAFDGVDRALTDVGANWYYTWAVDDGAIEGGVEFVPMIWGANSVTDANLATAKRNGRTLLGFNEPDFAEQANMSPDQALQLWPKLQATGMRLGSPAVAVGADRPGGWLDRFMQGARQRNYRVDFITLHWYGGDFSPAAVNQLRSYVQNTYDRYKLPIWVTEYALINFGGGQKYPSSAQQVAFIKGSTAMFEQLSYVERYAWFALPAVGDSRTGLYGANAVPNDSGKAYRAAG